jgi:hypothetical protein
MDHSSPYVELSAAAVTLDLHIGEKRDQRMGTHRDDCAGVECYQTSRCSTVKRKRLV